MLGFWNAMAKMIALYNLFRSDRNKVRIHYYSLTEFLLMGP